VELCSNQHQEICFDGRKCPLCVALDEISEQKDDIKELEGKVNDLESEVEDLQKEPA
jgi:polyhydroxyalkanoate synthesis regulator phasin